MIEFAGNIQHILRHYEKDAALTVRRATPIADTVPTGNRNTPPPNPVKTEQPALSQEASVINFDHLPSGNLQLKEDERQNIIDFFE